MSAEREIIEAAEAVVARWYSPKWKDEPHTAEVINRLRAALAAKTVAGPTMAIPDGFDEVLFDLCRKDDYNGLLQEFVKRGYLTGPTMAVEPVAVAWMHPISGAIIKAEQRIEGVTLCDFNIALGRIVPAATVSDKDRVAAALDVLREFDPASYCSIVEKALDGISTAPAAPLVAPDLSGLTRYRAAVVHRPKTERGPELVGATLVPDTSGTVYLVSDVQAFLAAKQVERKKP